MKATELLIMLVPILVLAITGLGFYLWYASYKEKNQSNRKDQNE